MKQRYLKLLLIKWYILVCFPISVGLMGCASGFVYLSKSDPVFVNKDSKNQENIVCLEFFSFNDGMLSEDEIDNLLGKDFFKSLLVETKNDQRKWKSSCITNEFNHKIKVEMTSGLSESSKFYQYFYLGIYTATLGIVPLYTKITIQTRIERNGNEIFYRKASGGALAGIIMLPFSPFTKSTYDVVKDEIRFALKAASKDLLVTN